MTGRSMSVKPEVVYLFDLLREVQQQDIRIPRFQRPFVWRPDQMLDLLESVRRQYPIGSLLIWETDESLSTLETLGPFKLKDSPVSKTGYLLDGHQRVTTLASALLEGGDQLQRSGGASDESWRIYWNIQQRAFVQRSRSTERDHLFPLVALLDTVAFFNEIALLPNAVRTPAVISDLQELARTFQTFRLPVVRLLDTDLNSAVEIFARLNSRGQPMSNDQMVSALTFSETPGSGEPTFNLSSEIDSIEESLAALRFGGIPRNTVLQCVLVNAGYDAYRTDWKRFSRASGPNWARALEGAIGKTTASLEAAVRLLQSIGVVNGRLLPYGAQLVALSSFFGANPVPSDEEIARALRFFWVSSFSSWFGGANPSRISEIFDDLASPFFLQSEDVVGGTLSLATPALPYPSNFDLRSARTRTLLNVELFQIRRVLGDKVADSSANLLGSSGTAALGHVFALSREFVGNPANRVFDLPELGVRGSRSSLLELVDAGRLEILEALCIDERAVSALVGGNMRQFILARSDFLQAVEGQFMALYGVASPEGQSAQSALDSDLE